MRTKQSSLAVFLALLAALSASAAVAQRKPVALKQATQIGKAVFPPGDTSRGGNGQAVDGIQALDQEMLKTHFHAHLALFYRGKQIAIPYGIGIVRPFHAEYGFVSSGKALYWMHTHDATGIIHIESPDNRPYTLGNFFDIWGRPLARNDVAGLRGKVQAFVDGKPYAGDLKQIALKEHTEVTLVVGEPSVTPPRYEFPKGL
jgi:hypothetical protein